MVDASIKHKVSNNEISVIVWLIAYIHASWAWMSGQFGVFTDLFELLFFQGGWLCSIHLFFNPSGVKSIHPNCHRQMRGHSLGYSWTTREPPRLKPPITHLDPSGCNDLEWIKQANISLWNGLRKALISILLKICGLWKKAKSVSGSQPI